MTESVRLSKRVADQFTCSRREAENYIEGGWVRLDGRTTTEPGIRVTAEQHIELAHNACADDRKPATFILHKPAGCDLARDINVLHELITPATQITEDRSARRFIKKDLAQLALVMTLEPQASGLVILTQAPGIIRKFAADKTKIEQEYILEVSGKLSPEGLQRLNHGLSWQGKPLAPAKVSWQNETHLRFALKDPAEGQPQDMCRQVGLRVGNIKRIRIGRFPMAGLPEGSWRYLLGYERF
ncbi:RNA-binding protein [Alcaligenaceae bacterium CGII-47]|nr:RNA-binding protein [Alcaligenaceae bacterium CGII-47]